jgi:hypothetical protein
MLGMSAITPHLKPQSVDELFKPYEEVSSGTGKIYKRVDDGQVKYVRSTGLFSRIRLAWSSERASATDLEQLKSSVASYKKGHPEQAEKIQEAFARTLDLFAKDSSLREAANEVRKTETKQLEQELGKIKSAEIDGFTGEQVNDVLKARAWIESFEEPTELEEKLRELIGELGLEISKQFNSAHHAVDKEFGKDPRFDENDPKAIEKAKNAVEKSPFIAKVATWDSPFGGAKFAEVIKLASINLPAARRSRSQTISSVLTSKAEAIRDRLPKTPQARVLDQAPVYNGESFPAKHKGHATGLQNVSVWKGKPALTSEQAEQLTQYIEANRDKLTKLAKDSPNQSIFIARGKSKLPRSIQVSIENGKPCYYILLKSGLRGKKEKIGILGKGGEKTVKLALDYNDTKLVASAAVGSDPKNALDEYVAQKLFGGAKSMCRYTNSKGKDVVHIIMPLANRGELSYENFQALSSTQRKEFVLSAASLLRQIHDGGYVSTDIKHQNILMHVDDKGHAGALITDHGSTVKRGDKIKFMTSEIRPVEVQRNKAAVTQQNADPAQDIWAFGKTLFIITHKIKKPPWYPWGERGYEQKWKKAKPETLLEKLCHRMTAPNPANRPDMNQVVDELNRMQF